MSIAYAMNQLEASPFVDPRGLGIVAAVYSALGEPHDSNVGRSRAAVD
jgi:hypothetical protein